MYRECCKLHIQIPPTGYVRVAYNAVPLWVFPDAVLLRVLWGYSAATRTEGCEATRHPEYPHSILHSTVACCSYSNTVLYAGHRNLNVYIDVNWNSQNLWNCNLNWNEWRETVQFKGGALKKKKKYKKGCDIPSLKIDLQSRECKSV